MTNEEFFALALPTVERTNDLLGGMLFFLGVGIGVLLMVIFWGGLK